MAMNEANILIQFNPETWMPAAILCNGETDTETAKLREIANMMLTALPDQEVVSSPGSKP
jgi:hypothetical protein